LRWRQAWTTAQATRLLSAAVALREGRGVPWAPADCPAYEQHLLTMRAQVDEVTWEAAWAAGRAMSLEQAIAYALEQTSSYEPGSTPLSMKQGQHLGIT